MVGAVCLFCLLFYGSARTAVAIVAESTLYRTACPCKVGVFRECLPRVVAGAIQVGDKSADNEKTMEVGGGHDLDGSRRNLLVVHGFSPP